MPEFKASEFIALAERERVTHTVMVPAMYNLCLLQPGFERADLSAWRIGGYGGAPMPESTIATLAARLPRLGLINAYGATETTSPATLLPAASAALRPDSVGLALPCADIVAMDESRAANCRPVNRANCGFAVRWSFRATGTTPTRRVPLSPPASGTRATWARSTPKGTCASSTASRT